MLPVVNKMSLKYLQQRKHERQQREKNKRKAWSQQIEGATFQDAAEHESKNWNIYNIQVADSRFRDAACASSMVEDDDSYKKLK